MASDLISGASVSAVSASASRPGVFPVKGVDIQDMGNGKEGYRQNLLIKNNRARDDYAQIMELGKTLSVTGSSVGGELDLRSQAVMDVDQWLRNFAYESLVGINDTYNQGLAHNFQLFVRPEDQRVVALPWDQDFAFHQCVEDSFTTANLVRFCEMKRDVIGAV